jgi:peroxiredoxin
MGEKLQQGDRFPSLTLKLADGTTIRLPDEMPTRYAAVLFYRGHWWPYCGRQLAAYEDKKAELAALGATIYAASVDTLEQAREVVGRGLTFPVAYGVTREESAVLGAWWDRDRGFIQPAEFLLGRGGIVLGSMYASGPVGRMGADEAVRLITMRERRRREQEPGTH